jgi:hypothetical protein
VPGYLHTANTWLQQCLILMKQKWILIQRIDMLFLRLSLGKMRNQSADISSPNNRKRNKHNLSQQSRMEQILVNNPTPESPTLGSSSPIQKYSADGCRVGTSFISCMTDSGLGWHQWLHPGAHTKGSWTELNHTVLDTSNWNTQFKNKQCLESSNQWWCCWMFLALLSESTWSAMGWSDTWSWFEGLGQGQC